MLKKMNKSIKIKKGQYLNEVIDKLQTNTVYFKVKTGIGATTLEIETERDSIIIEPNVPVIRGKKRKGILSIYEKVGIEEVVNYLMSNNKFKKILVTPESFYKVMVATQILDIDVYNSFFLLFDECDRTIKDVAFRPKILIPMDAFFKFKNKAFISATAIQPSDPKFAEQGFQSVYIQPDYEDLKSINLISTNNILLSLNATIKGIDNSNICIFVNSTNLIGSIIKSLGINDQSTVYCSRESSQQLGISGIKNVYDNIAEFKKFNFFTSRFFSAVDIIMETKPTVIIITDLHSAWHSMIDPYCDTTQIIGRFRKGYREVYHISNFNSDIQSKNKRECEAYLLGCSASYSDIKALKEATLNQGSKDTLESALKLVPYANFLDENEQVNHFMVDNFILEERVKNSYISFQHFEDNYKKYGYTVNASSDIYSLSDQALLKVKKGINNLEVVKSVIEAIKIALNPDSLFSLRSKQEVLNELSKSHPLIIQGYKILGEAELLKNGYSKKAIKKALDKKLMKNDCADFGFLKYLQSKIVDGVDYTIRELRDIFNIGIKDHNLRIQPKPSIMMEIFNLSPRKTISGTEEKGYKVISCRFNRID